MRKKAAWREPCSSYDMDGLSYWVSRVSSIDPEGQLHLAQDPRVRVRAELASRDDLTAEAAQVLCQSPERGVRWSLLENQNGSSPAGLLDLVEKELSDPNGMTLQMMQSAVANPLLPLKVALETHYRCSSIFPAAFWALQQILYNVSMREDMTPAAWEEIAQLPSVQEQTSSMLDSPGLPAKVRRRVMRNGSSFELWRLALNPKLPDADAAVLVESGYPCGPRPLGPLTMEVVKRLISGTEGHGVESLLSSARLSEAQYLTLREGHENSTWIARQLKGMKLSENFVNFIFAEGSATERAYIISNRNVPNEPIERHLESISKDPVQLSAYESRPTIGREAFNVINRLGLAGPGEFMRLESYDEDLPLRVLQAASPHAFGAQAKLLLDRARTQVNTEMFDVLAKNWVGTLKELKEACIEL